MMTSTTQSAGPRECPICGRLVPDHAPESLCLSCLLDTGQDEDPAVKPPDPTTDLAEGTRFFGDYELLREAGRGGMGVVYEARQFGTQRVVALKLLSSGPFASADNVHRFHTEAAAAARLEHPHIVPVYEAGMHEGQYFLAMRFLSGGTLADQLRQGPLPDRQAAELLRAITDAVRHAHQRGVLHRDLKPGNILLDAEGRPGVADFGLARLTDDDSSLTLSHAMLGTVAYLAPEVAGGGAAQATTAADIYGLGAVLYEMLTGQPPFREATIAETVRAVQEQEPVPVNQFNPAVSGDLATICHKCLEKNPAHRYAGAVELAEDLQHFLADEPIVAVSPSVAYRLKKFVLRNRVAIAIGAIVVMGALISAWQAIRATHSERHALAAQSEAEAALRFLRDDFLARANPFLANPNRPPNRNLTLLSAIQMAVQGIEDRYPDQPLVEAEIRVTVGKAFLSLGEIESAEGHLRAGFNIFERELGSEDRRTLEAAQGIAWLLIDQSRYAEAAELSRELMEARHRELGPDDPLTLEAMNCLGHAYRMGSRDVEALDIFREVITRTRTSLSPDYLTLLTAQYGMSRVYYEMGDFAENLALDREIYRTAREALGPDHPLTLEAMVTVLANLRLRERAFAKSEEMALEAKQRCLRVLGEEHPTTISLLSEIAILMGARGLNGMPSRRTLAEVSADALGRNHPSALNEQLRYGLFLSYQSHLQEGEEVLVESMRRIHQSEGPDTFLGERAMRWLSGNYIAQGRLEEAENLRVRVVEAGRRLKGEMAPWTHRQTFQLANVYARQGKWQESALVYQAFLPHAPEDYVIDGSMKPGVAWRALEAGLLASCLAADFDGAREVAEIALARFGHTEDASIAYVISRCLLLVPDVVSDGGQALHLADLAVELLRDPLKQRVLAGISSYRRGDWEATVDQLEPLAPSRFEKAAGIPASQQSSSLLGATGMEARAQPGSGASSFPGNPDGCLASLTGFFVAMAYHRLGQDDEAQGQLAAANARLERITRSGDLGNTTTYPDAEWTPYGAAIIVRDEAERLVYGRRFSSPIDAQYLPAARDRWKPVKGYDRAGKLAGSKPGVDQGTG